MQLVPRYISPRILNLTLSGVQRFVICSAKGADAHSSIFYSRTKGQAEQELEQIGFSSLHIMHPGVLLGAREESRPLEAIVRKVSPTLNHIMVGPLRQYRAILADHVALAMIFAAKSDTTGVHRYVYDDMERMAAEEKEAVTQQTQAQPTSETAVDRAVPAYTEEPASQKS